MGPSNPANIYLFKDKKKKKKKKKKQLEKGVKYVQS